MNASQARARAFFLNCRIGWRSCKASRQNGRCRQYATPAHQPNRFRPFYVTSPIFYVNAEPHAGHLYTVLLADVFKRWQVLKGDQEAALLTGTDEHGMKVQKAAEAQGMLPKDMCDKNAQQFLRLADRANVSYDRFIRTTDPDHKLAVEHFWKELRKRDYIYESKHEGWYSVSDETFYPESQVHLVLDPATGRKHYASMETGKEVEWTSEMNYHFRLSAFRDRLLEHYDQHPEFIVPVQRMNFIKKEVESGLQDLSVSRPSLRLQWGIRVPDDDTQTIYVWLDALINYLTATGYPTGNGDKHKLWPPNVQVIGKDIVRFHCIYWPAFLMALDIPLPRGFLTHAHWTMGTTKMSKSLGNGVNPFLAIERYDLDTIRYFMIHDGGIVDDADYDNSYIVAKYKKGLQNGLGNLISRVLRGRQWNVGDCVAAMSGTPADDLQLSLVKELVTVINQTANMADQAMNHLNPRQALHTIMDLVYEGSRFFSTTEPWVYAKSGDGESIRSMQSIIFASSELIRIACILLQPFMPDKMRQALDELKVAQDKRTFEYATYGSDTTYGQHATESARDARLHVDSPGRKRMKYAHEQTLFPPLITEF